MHPSQTRNPSGWQVAVPIIARSLCGAGVVALVMGSAVMTKRMGTMPALVSFDRTSAASTVSQPAQTLPPQAPVTSTSEPIAPERAVDGVEMLGTEEITPESPEWDLSTRWFDGRPVRPARVLLMRVTAYSPDHLSCGEFADGQTATLHSVWTNGMRLVAADPTVLPYGTMLTVPGYADNEIVPVLDCGGAIKGNRLDLLYPTHEIARRWGVQDLRVVIWEYADGEPAPNPRRVR